MDTKTSTPINASFIGWDEKGYGPNGKHTRQLWREECIENLLAGKNQFDAWQDGWKDQINEELENISFGFRIFKDVIATSGELNRISRDVDTILELHKPYTLDFTGVCFFGELLLNQYIFKQPTLFRSAYFDLIVNFQNAEFENSVNFENAVFNDTNDFTNSKFLNSVNFKKAYFKKPIFINATFGGHYVNFDFCVFESEVNFGGAQFPNNFMELLNISFYKSEFRKQAHFQNLNFKVKTNFKYTKFIAGVNFEGTSFNHDICFENVTFGDCNFDLSNIWRPQINFIDTKFNFDVKFNFAKFSLPTYFVNTKFYGDAEFNNVIFNEDIRLFGTKFEGGAFFNDAVFTGNAVKRLGQMKRMAEDNGQTDQALNFNALELNAKAKLPKVDIAFIVITKFYEIISDYGRSYVRPLIVYLILFLITLCLGFWNASQNVPIVSKCEGDVLQIINTSFKLKCLDYSIKKDDTEINGFRAAFEYAAYRGSGLIDFSDNGKQTAIVSKRVFGQNIEPGWARGWGIFKAIASTVLLFLAALGLRNKYRIK